MESLYDLVKDMDSWMFMISEGCFYIQGGEPCKPNPQWRKVVEIFPSDEVTVGTQYVHIKTSNSEEYIQSFLSLLKTKDVWIMEDMFSGSMRYFCTTTKGIESLKRDHLKEIEEREKSLSSFRRKCPSLQYKKYSST